VSRKKSDGKKKLGPKIAVRAVAPYKGTSLNELTFEKDDMIHILYNCLIENFPNSDNSGNSTPKFIEGEISGHVGLFPTNCVDFNYQTANLKVIVHSNFESTQPGEINLQVGEILTLVTSENGKLIGVDKNGKTGKFPASHVKIITDS